MIERIGNYKITDEIGSGGMAVVYKGVQESLNRTVAIKALKTVVMSDENVVARFEREAVSIASFQQENIITVYDFFREQGSLFIIMEYVEGIDLYDLLDRKKSLPNDIAAIVSLQVARALDYAHFRGVIHRDVKPANIIISKRGTVKLMDFGIAKVETSDLTQIGVGLGTPAYMSPEQVIGDKLDHRSDIFSLGIVMYQMVAGQKPFVEDDERSAMQKIRLDTPPSPRSLNPNVHKELERIILRCMEKTPDHRYASTQDLVITLEQYLAKTVRHNYRARLLLYLREQNLLTDDETSATLHPAFIGDYLESHPRQLYRRRWRWLFLSIIFLLIAIILGILNLVQLPANFKWKKRLATPQICAQNVAEQKNYGYLRVLVHPWAQVEIDGKIAATTPFDQPLTLKTGKHVVRLINRYFETVRQEVEIKKDQVHSIVIALQRKAPGKVEP